MSNRRRGRPEGGWITDAERRPALLRIRDKHRYIAELFAAGLTRNQVADHIGMTPERVGQLYNDPAMQELIAQYRNVPEVVNARGLEELAFVRKNSLRNLNRAVMHMSDRLDMADEEGIPLSIRDAKIIAEFGADRLGFSRNSTTTHVFDFAQELERRRAQRLKTIDATVVDETPHLHALRGEENEAPKLAFSSPTTAGDGRQEREKVRVVGTPSPSSMRRC